MFATNALILELGMIAYNILRMIGQGTIGGWAPRQKRDVKRRRLRTVISNLIMMAGHITMHARQLITGLGRSNIWRHIFSDIRQLKHAYNFTPVSLIFLQSKFFIAAIFRCIIENSYICD